MDVQKAVPEIVEKILDEISKRYGLDHSRAGIHATDLIYCLRKVYWAKTDPLPPTPKELLYYIRGLAMQDVMLDKPSTKLLPFLRDEITASPDYIVDGIPLELKTTLIGKKRLDTYDFPAGWLKQLMAYCSVMGVEQAVLVVFTIIQTEILSYILNFTDEELLSNWNELLGKKAELKLALESNVVPRPLNEEFECKDCKYRLRCMELEI